MIRPSISNDLALVLSSNSTATSFASKVPTTTAPTTATAGVLASADGAGRAAYGDLFLLPFGRNANNLTFDLRVIGWRKVSTLWVPTLLCQASCTTSSSIPGVSGAAVTDSDLFCDTISVTNGIGVVVSPVADSQPAWLLVSCQGSTLVEVLFDRTGATEANALYSWVG